MASLSVSRVNKLNLDLSPDVSPDSFRSDVKGELDSFSFACLLEVTSAATAEEGNNGMFFRGFSKDSNVPGCMKSYICEGDTKSN